MTAPSVGTPAQAAIQDALNEYYSEPQEVEMISGNNGRNVQGLLEGKTGHRPEASFENSQTLADNVNKYSLDWLIDASARENDLSASEVDTLREFQRDIEAGNDAANNNKTDQTALLVDDKGLIAKVADHSDVASQIDGTSARDLGGSPNQNTVAGESIEFNRSVTIGANEYGITEQYNIKSNQFWSPLALDIGGNGVGTTNETIRYDINGDGHLNTVNDVEGGVLAMGSGSDGSELLGNNTDLGLGNNYDNGFDALRTLAQQHNMVGGSDQRLDQSELSELNDEVGLGVKTDGYQSETQSFDDVGVAQINLGEQGNTEWHSNFDGRGNAVQTQEGATFVNDEGEENDYVDVWHRNA